MKTFALRCMFALLTLGIYTSICRLRINAPDCFCLTITDRPSVDRLSVRFHFDDLRPCLCCGHDVEGTIVLISLQIGLLASYADPVRLQSKIESTIGRPHQTIRKEHLAEFLPLA